MMIGFQPNIFWKVCWAFVTPTILTVRIACFVPACGRGVLCLDKAYYSYVSEEEAEVQRGIVPHLRCLAVTHPYGTFPTISVRLMG